MAVVALDFGRKHPGCPTVKWSEGRKELPRFHSRQFIVGTIIKKVIRRGWSKWGVSVGVCVWRAAVPLTLGKPVRFLGRQFPYL